MGLAKERRLALGMRDEFGVGIGYQKTGDFSLGKSFVNDTGPLPEHHLASGLLGNVRAQVAIRSEDDPFVVRDALDDFNGVRARHDHIALRFNCGRAIDVRDNEMIRVSGAKFREGFGRAAIRKRAPGAKVREQHFGVRIEDFRALGHEMDACEKDESALGLLGGQRVPDCLPRNRPAPGFPLLDSNARE